MEEENKSHNSDILAFWNSVSPDAVKVHSCERFGTRSPIWNLDRHAHDFFEFLYFIDGRAQIDAGQENLSISMFNLVIYPPNVYHEEKLDLRFNQEVYTIWAEMGSFTPFNQGILVKDSDGEFRHVFDAIYKEFSQPKILKTELCEIYMRTILLLLKRYFIQAPQENEDLIHRCISFINEHYKKDFDITEMAKSVYVSESYLFRYFKKKMGMTPMQYRNKIRIEKAKALLCKSNLKLEYIAESVGITDVKHFSHLFKKIEGTTPGTFRQKRQE